MSSTAATLTPGDIVVNTLPIVTRMNGGFPAGERFEVEICGQAMAHLVHVVTGIGVWASCDSALFSAASS